MNDVLLEAMRAREHLIEPARERLLDGVRTKLRRRRVTGAIGAGTAVLALAGLVVAGAAVWPRGGADAPPVAASATPDGWRPASALGVQLRVPVDWTDNDYRCQMGDRPSVIHPGIRLMGRACLPVEPDTKELAFIQPSGAEGRDALPDRPVTIGGEPGRRAEGRRADGRYAGWVNLPGRDVTVLVRTRDPVLTARILDSVELVDVDHAGCPTHRPARPGQPARDPFVDPAPRWISICDYSDEDGARLQGSARLTGEPADRLAAAINASRPGRTPDEPEQGCTDATTHPPGAVLYVGSAGGRVAPVWVTFTGCRGRGIDNGSNSVRVSVPILMLIFQPMSVGFAFITSEGGK